MKIAPTVSDLVTIIQKKRALLNRGMILKMCDR